MTERLVRELSGLSALSAPFPTLDRGHALYGLAGDFVGTLEPHTEADPAGLLVSFLVDFGCLVGRGPHTHGGGTRHGANLFAALVGDTSKGRKGTTDAEVRRVMTLADEEYVEDRRKSGFVSGEAFMDAFVSPDDRRLLMLESEFVRILRTTKGSGNFAPLLRQAWDGGRLEHRSVRRGQMVVKDTHIALMAHITASELRSVLTTAEVGGGLMNRVLLVATKRSKVLPFGGNTPTSDVERLGKTVSEASIVAADIESVTYSEAAGRRWSEGYQARAVDSPDGLLGFLVARDDAQVLRLGLLYALLDGSDVIDVDHLEAALAVWRYCRDSAAYIFGAAISDATAERLLDALRSAGRLTGVDQRNVFAGHTSAMKLKDARAHLIRLGLAREEIESTPGRPIKWLVYTGEVNI